MKLDAKRMIADLAGLRRACEVSASW